MDQPTYSDWGIPGQGVQPRRELFLERMDGLIPWKTLGERIRHPTSPALTLFQGGPRAPALPAAGDVAGPLCAVVLQPPLSLEHALGDPGMEDPRYSEYRVCSTRPNRYGGPWG